MTFPGLAHRDFGYFKAIAGRFAGVALVLNIQWRPVR